LLIRTKYLTKYTAFKVLELSRISSFLTLGIISKVALGQAFGFLVSDEDRFQYLEDPEPLLAVLVPCSMPRLYLERSRSVESSCTGAQRSILPEPFMPGFQSTHSTPNNGMLLISHKDE